MLKKIERLIDVKSIITFGIVGTVLVLALKGTIEATKVYELSLMVLSFYFGVKITKNETKDE